MRTVVGSFDAKTLWRKTDDHRVKTITRKDEMALIRRFVTFPFLSILADSLIDFDFVGTDVFLGIEHQFYLRVESETTTYADAETEREERLPLALKCIAWTTKHFATRAETMRLTRNELKPRPNESRDEFNERWINHTQFICSQLWCVYKSEHKLVEETLVFSCHRCRARFEQELLRGVKLPVTIKSKTHWVRFCTISCRNKYIEESAIFAYRVVIAQVFAAFDQSFLQLVLNIV